MVAREKKTPKVTVSAYVALLPRPLSLYALHTCPPWDTLVVVNVVMELYLKYKYLCFLYLKYNFIIKVRYVQFVHAFQMYFNKISSKLILSILCDSYLVYGTTDFILFFFKKGDSKK